MILLFVAFSFHFSIISSSFGLEFLSAYFKLAHSFFKEVNIPGDRQVLSVIMWYIII